MALHDGEARDRSVIGQLPDLFNLSGRVALVSGGSRGLGKAMAMGLAQAGADVLIVSRKEKELEQTREEIEAASGVTVYPIAADLGIRSEAARVASEALGRAGRVDILVNNVGTSTPQAIDLVDDADWDRIIGLNLTSTMALTRALVPQMKSRGWGRVVYTASIMAFASKEGRSAYSASKAGIIAMAKAQAIDLGPSGITVNCISPGLFLTDLAMKLMPEQDKRDYTDRAALGRCGIPQELVGPLLMLVSDAGSYVTGTNILVDGGWLAAGYPTRPAALVS